MFMLIALVLSLLLVTLAAIAWEKLLFSRLFGDPLVARALAVPAAWLTCTGAVVLLAGPDALSLELFILWLMPASLVAVWFLHSGYRLRQKHRDPASIARDFD